MKPQQQLPDGIPPAALAALTADRGRGMTDTERIALERLIGVAKRDTGQSRRVADFLLAWWNASDCGSFDLTELRALDDAITADMTTVFAFIARVSKYPDRLGYEADFKAIVRIWRPDLAE